jgi:hypothetical protein
MYEWDFANKSYAKTYFGNLAAMEYKSLYYKKYS